MSQQINKLRELLAALRTSTGWYTVADAEKDILALFAQPAPVAVGGEGDIPQEFEDAMEDVERANFVDFDKALETTKHWHEWLARLGLKVVPINQPLSVPPAAEAGRTDALVKWCHNDARYKAPEQMLDVVISHNEKLAALARTLERENAQL